VVNAQWQFRQIPNVFGFHPNLKKLFLVDCFSYQKSNAQLLKTSFLNNCKYQALRIHFHMLHRHVVHWDFTMTE